MRVAAWLALRDVTMRPKRAWMALAVVAAVTTAGVTLELVARVREEAVSARVDAMGPALTVVPMGVTRGALARLDLGQSPLPAGTANRIRATLGRDLRNMERRLVSRRAVAGREIPILGVETVPEGRVELGSELARLLAWPSALAVAGRELQVASVRPSEGTIEDMAVFVPMNAAPGLVGGEAANELRLYLRAGVSPRETEERLSKAIFGARIVRANRGAVADVETPGVLAGHRRSLQLVLAAVVVLCLAITAHLDASERCLEIATLVAVGASRLAVITVILARSAVVAAAGAMLGTALGTAVAAFQDPLSAGALVGASPLLPLLIASALGVGMAAATPTAVFSASRDPVAALQEVT
jgi:hypothetical protein